MRTRFHQILRDFAVYGTGEILARAFSFLTLPIYTRLFSPEEYGVLSYVLSLVGLIGAVLVLGGDSAYARFFYEAKTLEDRRRLTATWIGFLGAFGAVVTILILIPASGIVASWSFGSGDRTMVLVVAFVGVPLGTVNAILAQVLRNQFRPRVFTVLNVASMILNVGLGLFFVIVVGLGLAGVFAGMAVAAALILPVRAWTVRDLLRPRFSIGLLRELLAYGLPLVPASLAFWVFLTSDRILLGRLSTLEQLGWYSVAVSLSGLLGLANNALASAWAPHGIQMYEEDPKRASVEFGRIMTYVLGGMGLLCIGISTFAPELLRLLSHEEFYPAAAAVGPLAFAMIAYASVQITAAGISLKKQTKYIAIVAWAAAALNVVLNLALDGPFGMMGAAWATTAAYSFLTLGYFVIAQRLWPVTYERRRSLTVLALIIAFLLAAGFLPDSPTVPVLLLKSLYCLLFLLAAFGLRAFDKRELQMLLKLLPSRVGSIARR